MQIIASVIAILLYSVATAAGMVHLKKLSARGESDKRPLLWLWSGALLVHVIALGSRVLTPEGVNLAFFNSLSIVAALISALVLLSAIKRPVETLAIMVLPVAAVTLALDQFMPNQPVIAAPAGSSLQIHILISLVAYSLLSIAALQALVLAVQDWQLHNHRPGGLIRALPPLQWMEDLLFQLIAVGFALLSVSLLTGFFFLEDIFAQHLVHKTVLSIVAWLVFAVLLFGRMRFGWRGRTAIKWTLSGILTLMLAYFGSKLVLELILQRP
jgi:ABC-type uncharacterized transport system permease subunit